MVIHIDSLSILKKIDKYSTLKPLSIGEPDIYLGVKLMKMTMANGVWCWSMIPSKYVQEAVRNCETHLKKQYGGKYSIVKVAFYPFSCHYESKFNVSETLDPVMESYSQYLIGITRWLNWDALTLPLRCLCYHFTTITPVRDIL